MAGNRVGGPGAGEAQRSPGRFASGRTLQLSRELLPAATRRENQELKTDAPSGHGLAAAFGTCGHRIAPQGAV